MGGRAAQQRRDHGLRRSPSDDELPGLIEEADLDFGECLPRHDPAVCPVYHTTGEGLAVTEICPAGVMARLFPMRTTDDAFAR